MIYEASSFLLDNYQWAFFCRLLTVCISPKSSPCRGRRVIIFHLILADYFFIKANGDGKQRGMGAEAA